MVDSVDHWATVCVCNLCGNIPENAPLFHCPYQHQYCNSCFLELKQRHRGLEENKCFCELCGTPMTFKETRISPEFLKKLRSNPGIGRPYRYESNPLLKTIKNASKESETNLRSTAPPTVENLFGLPTTDLNKLFEKRNQGDIVVEEKLSKTRSNIFGNCRTSVSSRSNYRYLNLSQFSSHKPVVCPHHPCNRMIAVSSFANHFRYEHPELKKYATERHKDTLLPFDISLSECGKSLCLAIITIYENNKIDLLRSRSTHSVIKTCRKFCQKVPIDSFWVMLSGSKSRRKSHSYILIWLFSNSTDKYHSTIELSSKNDNVSFSCFSDVNGIPENLNVDEVAKKFNCLYVGYGSAAGLLREGSDLNLRIAVH